MEGRTRAQGSQEHLDWLGLKLIPGVGSVTFARLVEAFGSPGAALGAPLAALEALPRLRPQVARAVHRRAWEADPQEQLTRLDKLGGRLLIQSDPDYPPFWRASTPRSPCSTCWAIWPPAMRGASPWWAAGP